MGGGGIVVPQRVTKLTKNVAPYMAKLGNPLMHFASEEEQLFFSDPLNLTGVNTPEVESLPTSTTVSGLSAAEIEEKARLAAQAESDRTKKRKGYKSTVLTSMSGDTEDITTLKKTLGGAS